MLSRIVAFVLLVLFAMQTFQQNLMVLDYVANLTSYIEVCINKDRPGLKCKGKCQLMKKLHEEEKKQAQNPEQKGENNGYVLFSLPLAASLSALAPTELTTVYHPFPVSNPVDLAFSIFHPPAV